MEIIFLITHINIETTIAAQEYFTFQSKNLCWTYFFLWKKNTTCFESQKEKIPNEEEKQIVSYLEVSIFCKWERVSFKFEGEENLSMEQL